MYSPIEFSVTSSVVGFFFFFQRHKSQSFRFEFLFRVVSSFYLIIIRKIRTLENCNRVKAVYARRFIAESRRRKSWKVLKLDDEKIYSLSCVHDFFFLDCISCRAPAAYNFSAFENLLSNFFSTRLSFFCNNEITP